MEELRTTANLIDAFENGNPVAVLPRRELDEVFAAGEPAQLWLELGREGDEDVRLLSIDLTSADIEEMLGRSTGDDVLVALDGYALHGLFEDPDVEAHGLRSALAIAVVAGAVAAPAGLAANPQVSAASNPQVSAASSQVQAANPASRIQAANPASRIQAANPASRAQAANPASRIQAANPASRAQAANPASKAQISAASKAQLSKSLTIKASGLRLGTSHRPL